MNENDLMSMVDNLFKIGNSCLSVISFEQDAGYVGPVC
jgi:hypothetical protein